MDYFKFDLQLFGVDYENPSTKTSGSRHAIVLNTAQYHAFKDGAGAPAAGKMNTYEGYNVLTNIPAEAGPYFYGVDGELYAMGDDAMQTALKNMIRNETDGTRPVTEHFFLGTVTTDAEGKVISVTSFDDQDNLWYGETVDILKGAAYTAKGSNYIYSVNGDTDAPMVFQLMYPYGGTGNQEFTVDAETGKVVDFGTAASPVNYVLLFTGDMVVDLSGSNKFPKNIIFMNGNDDANGSIDRGYTYGKRSKDQPHYVGALMMDSTKTASVTVTGQDSATDIKINNRSYNVTSGIKFVRDFADNEASTSVIASIAGTDGDDTVTILASASGHALDTDFAVSGDIDLGDGDDTLQLGDSTHAQNYGGAILLGKGDDTVTIDNGSKRIDVAGGITGGAGDDTYNFAKASAAVGDVPATEITINDFAKGDTLNLNGMTVMTTSAGGVAITAGQKGFTLGAATGITVTDATRTLTIADVAEGTEFTVSGIADLTGALVFTADDTSYVLTADTLTVMTAKGATVYTVTDQTNLSYTAATGKLVSTETPAGIEGAKNELTLTLGLTGIDVTEYDTDTNYYAVTYNKTTGQYAIGDAVATEPTTAVDPAKLVGYFAMTVNKNVNQPTATLEYYAKGATKPSSFISGLTVDATALTEVEIKAAVVEPPSAAVNAPFKKLDVTDISLGTVEVRNVATDVASVEGTDAKNVYYVTQYALSTTGGADTITLVKGGDTDATVCYAITATKSGTDNKPVVTYSIAKTQTGAPPAAGTAYFSVVYDPDGADGGSYGVTFFPNKDAEEKTNVASLTADCWAGIKVNAEALGNTGTLTITPNTAVDSYAVSAKCGVIFNDSGDQKTLTRTGATIAVLNTEAPALSAVTLKTVGYYPVKIEKVPANSGKLQITIGAKQDGEPALGDDPTEGPQGYFHVTNTEGAGKIEYKVYTGGDDKGMAYRLSGLVGEDGKTAFLIPISGDDADITSLDITDTPSGGPTNVDYKVTMLPAGTKITGNTKGDDISNPYKTSYKANVTLKLADTKLPSDKDTFTTYYTVDADSTADTDGYKGVKVTATSTTEPANPTKTNYFAVTLTKVGEALTYTVAYHVATEGEKIVALSGTEIPVAGGVYVDTAGLTKDSIESINLDLNLVSGDPATIEKTLYNVTNIDEKNLPTAEDNIQTVTLGGSSDPVESEYKTYKDYYELGAATTISLAAVTEKTPRYYVATVETAASSGIHKYNIAPGVADKPAEGKSYFTASLKDGVLSLAFTQGDDDGAMTIADITTLLKSDPTAKFTVNASNLDKTVTSIALTDDTKVGQINYDVTNVPKAVTSVTNKGTGDDVAYQQTYVLDDSAKTITLGATEGIVCYKVTATGGTPALLGVNTVKIEASGVTIAKDATAEEIAAAMEKAKIANYFTVRTDVTGNVDISYTASLEGGIPLQGSDINVAVDASAAEQVADVEFTLSNTGSAVYKYSVDGLTKNQEVTKGAETTADPALSYEKSYEITGAPITLDNSNKATNAVDYYEITQTKKGTTADKGVVQWAIGPVQHKATAEAEITNAKHYIKVTYQSDYITSITYVNADGDKDFDLSAAAIGRITINAFKEGANKKVDTINIDATDMANYEVLHVQGGVTVNCDESKDLVSYDNTAVLTGSLTLSDQDQSEVYYQVIAGATTSGVTACTLGSKLTTKPGDTVNYVKVTRDGAGYTIDYVPATSGTALALDKDKSKLTVAASDATGNTVAPAAAVDDKTFKNAAGVVVDITGSAGGWTIANAANAVSGKTGTSTIAYSTNFAWAAGVYYIPVKAADEESTFKTGVKATTSGATDADRAKQYVVVTVKKDADGVFQIVSSTTTMSTVATGAISGVGAAYTGAITVQAPDNTAKWKFNAKNTGDNIDFITNVQNGAVITNIDNADDIDTTITTATLAKGDSFTVDVDATEGGETTFTAGAAGAISVLYDDSDDEFQVVSGVLALTEEMDEELKSYAGTCGVQVMSLGKESDGVVVTFDETDGITSVTGLSKDELVKVTVGVTTYQYVLSDDGTYIERTNTATLATDKAAASTGNILTLGYSDGSATQVGKFIWSNGDYYLAAAGKDKEVALTSTGAVPTTDAVEGTYYIEAKVGNEATPTLTLKPVLGNKLHMVDEAADYTGTVRIDNPEIAFFLPKESKTYGVAVTGAKTGSVFANLGSNDSVVSEAGATITMYGEAEYEAVAGKTLEFVGNALKNGAITLDDGTAKYWLSDGSSIATTDDGDDVVIVVTNGAVSSMKGLSTGKTVTVKTYDAKGNVVTTTTYLAGVDTDTKPIVTKSTEIMATGETTDVVYSLDAEGDEIIGAPEKAFKVTSNFAWDTPHTTGFFKIVSGTPALITDKTGQDTIKATDEGYIKAEITEVKGGNNVNTLKLTPMVVAADGKSLVEDTTGNFSGTATIDANSKIVNYDGTAKSTTYKVAFQNVLGGSKFTLAKNDTVKSIASMIADAKITVNGTEFISGKDSNQLFVYCDSKVARIISGTVKVSDTIYSTGYDTETKLASGSATLTLSADGDVLEKPNGVVATYDGIEEGKYSGKVTTLTGLDRGEAATITNADGSSVRYEAATNDEAGKTIWRTITDANGVATTVVKKLATEGTDVVVGGAGIAPPDYGDPLAANTYYTTTTASKAFAWTGDNKGGYVLVDAKGNATLADGTTTIGYQNYKATFIKAAIDGSDVLTLTSDAVDEIGRVGAGSDITEGNIKLALTMPTAGRKIVYQKNDGVDSLTVTGAANGSSFTKLGDLAKISITTSSLKVGEGFTLNEGTSAGTAVTYTAGAAGQLALKDGKAYSGTFQVTATALDAYVFDTTTKEETTSKITYTAGTKPPATDTPETDGALVTVSNGKISAVKGLGDGEKVVTVVQTIDKDGTVTRTRTTYLATKILAEGATKNSYTVTKTVEVGHVKDIDTYVETKKYSQIFANTSADVTVATGWTADDVTTAGTFNWKNTGYWLAKLDKSGTAATNPDYGKYVMGEYDASVPPKPLKIAAGHAHDISKETPDKSVFIAVESEKTIAGDYKVTSFKLVQVQKSGALTDFEGEIGTIGITAPGDGGLILPADHDGVFAITTTAEDKTFTLGAEDTLSSASLASGKAIGLVVGTETKTFTSALTGAVELKGNGTVTQGTFLVKDTMTASADPAYDADTCTKTITYTPGKDNDNGVKVRFNPNAIGHGGEIGTVTDLERGEKVVIESVTGTDGHVYETTTIEKAADSDKITKTISGSAWPSESALVMTKTDDNLTKDVHAMAGYTVSNKFDYGATDNGIIGVFAAGTKITTQTSESPAVTFAPDDYTSKYVMVGATKDSKTGATTIGYLQVWQANGDNLDVAQSDAAGVIEIAAPTTGDLVLGKDAVQLYTVYYDESNSSYKPGDEKYGTVDETLSEMKRLGRIAVTGAKDGQSFSNFTANDTVTGSGLTAGAVITVNKVAYQAAANGAMTISGDGYAKDGKFIADSKHTVSLAKVDVDGVLKDGTTTVKWSKGDGARVEISGDSIDEIKQIGAGETIVVTQTLEDGATTTMTYVATSITSGDDKGKILVTKTVESDGATTKYTMVIATDGDDIWTNGTSTGWTKDGDVTITSKFNWTAEGNSGYFLATVTEDSEGKLTGIGTVAVEPQTTAVKIDKKNAGSYYLKVTPEADNTVTAVGLYQVQADGSMKSVATTGLTGVINITAPTAALTYANVLAASPKIAVNITGATAKSVITLKDGDTLTTAEIAPSATRDAKAVAAATIRVNTRDYEAGAAGTMKFLAKGNGIDDALVSSGAIKLVDDSSFFYATGVDNKVGTTFDTDNVKVTYKQADETHAPAIVTVKNGVVTNITGLVGTDTLAVKVGETGCTYTYNAVGNVAVDKASTAVDNITLAALKAGKTITFTDTVLTSGADNNEIAFVNEGGTLTVKDGVLKFTGTAIKATGNSADALDYVQIAGGTTTPATVTATDATVTIKDGKVTSITGLKNGENIAITKHEKSGDTYVDTVETYSLTGSKLTKSVKVGTADPTVYTAYITDGADILAASYTGGSATVDTEEGTIVGQFAWDDKSNTDSKRATGYFEFSGHKAKPVADQPSEIKLAAKAADTNYLVASVAEMATGAADGTRARQLTLGGLTVYGTKSAKKGQTADYVLTKDDVITITAPTTATPVNYKKDGPFQLIVNKLTANSVISDITKGDKVTTAALAEGDQIKVGRSGYENPFTAVKGSTLTFVGETDGAETPILTAALLSGKIKIAANGSAVLSGDTEKNDDGKSANDVTVSVSAGATSDVVVNVANGVPTSITNLKGNGATVTITKAGAATVQYKVLDANSTMIQRTEFTDTNGDGVYTEGTDTLIGSITRKTLTKAGLELDNAKAYMAGGTTTFKPVVTLNDQDRNFSALEWATGGTKTAYVRQADLGKAITSKTAADAGVASGNMTDGTKVFDPAEYVLKATMNTNANTKVTTISKIDWMKADAQGKLVAVPKTDVWPNFAGAVVIDGAASTTPTNDTDALINFTLPAYGTARTWHLAAQNVAIGSVFKNFVDGDAITTATKTGFDLEKGAKGTFTLYSANAYGNTNTVAITYTGDGAKVDIVDNGTPGVHDITLSNLLLSNFQSKGEKLTMVRTVEAAGEKGETTTIYEYVEDAKAGKLIRKTETTANGTKTVTQYKITGTEAATFDLLSDAVYENPDPMKNTIVSNFDWTVDKNTTGYFAVASGKAAVKATKTTITSKNTGVYIAVAVDADGKVAADGITAVRYDTDPEHAATTQGTMVSAGADAFSGTITITAPAKTYPLTLDRTAALTDGSITATATKLAITGALAGSTIDHLTDGDTVTTAALKSANAVTLDTINFTAGANGALTITMQTLEDELRHTLTAGTVVLDNRAGGNIEGVGFLYVGTSTLVEAVAGTSITVQASANGKNFTIGDIGEHEQFKINGVTYKKSDKTLLRATVNAETGNTEYAVYNIGAAKTITSAVLDNSKVWKSTTPTFTDDDPTGNTNHTFTVDLAQLDSRVKKDIANHKATGNADAATYDFVIDRYLSTDVKSNAALTAAVVANAADAWQVALGTGADDTYDPMVPTVYTWGKTRTYTASGTLTVGQTIKAAKDWNVVGTNAADIITGASANSKDVVMDINGRAGNDTITGGGATENFVVGDGNDVLKSYATGKDKIQIAGAATIDEANVYLAGTGYDSNGKTKLTGVLLHRDGTEEKGYSDSTDSVLLAGMGNGKAVSISTDNGATYASYYFGDGTKTKGAMTFAFETGAYYFANSKQTNTLKVTTDTKKATKTTIGDTVVVDLTATNETTGVSYYHYINAVDASASGNRVYLKAADTGSLLKGGSYESTLQGGAGNDTLQGGSGADVFWFKDGLDGSDTIKGYTATKNDAVYLGEWTSGGSMQDGVEQANGDTMEANGFIIKAEGNNVVLTNASGLGKATLEGAAGSTKAVRFSMDGKAGNALSYYVAASTTKANTFTAKDADVTKGGDSVYKGADNSTLKNYSYKHYYVGTSTATDTLKITSTERDGIKAVFSLESTNLSSIDVLDASGLNKKSTVALIGATDRNCTLKGSAANTERFVVQAGNGKTTFIEGFTLKSTSSIGDIIEIAGGDSIKAPGYKDGSYISFDLNNGGKISIKGASLANFSSVKAGDTTIRGTK